MRSVSLSCNTVPGDVDDLRGMRLQRGKFGEPRSLPDQLALCTSLAGIVANSISGSRETITCVDKRDDTRLAR